MVGRIRRTRNISPTETRLSEHFLLSDFLGCHSVYLYGHPNPFVGGTAAIAEGKHLCETLLEPIMAEYGPLSISYGYISPALSKKIVKYMDPDAPSYHRWDKGAAADICVHAYIRKKAPIYLAHEIDESLPYSRVITYSESPFVCVASQISEGDKPRRAFYENRYMGTPKAKPLYIRKPASDQARELAAAGLRLHHDWRGSGYPTYHGGGVRQWQHRRCSDFTMISDFLYSEMSVERGGKNIPGKNNPAELFHAAGEFYDKVLRSLSVPRVSIVRAFEALSTAKNTVFSWEENFALELVPPSYIEADELAQACWDTGMIKTVGVDVCKGRVRVFGR